MGKKKRKKDTENQAIQEEVKERRRTFQDARRENKKEALDKYYEAQRKLRKNTEENIKRETKEKLRKILNSKEPRNEIWKARKMMTKKEHNEYNYITEDNKEITNEEETKTHIAAYYEELYQAREGKPEYQAWTNKITKAVRDTAETLKHQNIEEITTQEMKKAQKKLQNKKATGPDDIPNEIFTKATNRSMDIYRTMLNNTAHHQEIPEEWKKGNIISIYKGKGKKRKCSNERGITLSSNIGKFYERIIHNRLKQSVTVSEMQGGGKEGIATADHILLLNELINKGKTRYITFLDVTKAYDKAWADAIMYTLHKNGVRDKTWMKVKELNENLTATVRTKYGPTREINIKNSIRQGGVLSVVMYALLIDEIGKEIKKEKLGIEVNPGEKIGCLMWMDDIALIADTAEEMQKMLNITNDIANRYHIEFGQEKSKTMRIGKKTTRMEQLKLGHKDLEECEKYKYLGKMVNKKNNQEDHIEETKKKAEGALQTILQIAGSPDLKGIEMKVIWQLVEACIIPIITYAAEANAETRNEMKKTNQILDNILKRILMLPITTPREIIYAETGLWDIEHTITRNKINLYKRIRKKGTDLMKRTIEHSNKQWKKQIQHIMEHLQIDEQTANTEIKKKVEKQLLENIKSQGDKKSKVKYYLEKAETLRPGKRKAYLEQLNRKETQMIMLARARMISVKRNYKNKYPNMNCRFCNTQEETQRHVLEECRGIDRAKYPKVKEGEIFGEDPKKLKKTAGEIQTIEDHLRTISAAPAQ